MSVGKAFNGKRHATGNRIGEGAHRDRELRPWIGYVEEVWPATDETVERRRETQEQRRRLDEQDVRPPHHRYCGGRDDGQAPLVDHPVDESTVRPRHHRQAKNLDVVNRLAMKAECAVARADATVGIVRWTGQDPHVMAQFAKPDCRLSQSRLGRPEFRREVVGDEQDAHGSDARRRIAANVADPRDTTPEPADPAAVRPQGAHGPEFLPPRTQAIPQPWTRRSWAY